MTIGNFIFTNTNKELQDIADEGSLSVEQDDIDFIRTRLTTDYRDNIVKTFGETPGGILADIHSSITANDKIEILKQSQVLSEFSLSLRNINIELARVIQQIRERINNDDVFRTDIIIPYTNNDISGIRQPTENFLSNIETNFTTLYNIYDNNRQNATNINNILEIKEKILFDTIANIQLYEQKNNVDVRKNLYEFERSELYNNIFHTLKIIYFSLLIIYIIFGNFIKEEMYKKKYVYLIIIVYIASPFMLKYIFAGIIFIYESIKSLLGNNKQVLTYDDIVRANNIDNIYTSPVPNIRDRMDVIRAYSTFVRNPRNQNLPFVNSTAQSLG